MISSEIRQKVERATVLFDESEGRGFVVSGGYILTSANVLEFALIGAEAEKSEPAYSITTSQGTISVSTLFIDSIQDIALLGPSKRSPPANSISLEEIAHTIEPLELFSDDLPLLQKVDCEILLPDQSWVEAIVAQTEKNASSFVVTSETTVAMSASGGPCVLVTGEVLGPISIEPVNQYNGRLLSMLPRPHMTLPEWAWEEINTNPS